MALPSTLQWLEFNDTVHGYITQDRGVGSGTPHYANDIQTPFHTQLGAPWDGTVITPPGGEGNYPAWGGQIFVRMSTGSVYYMYHLDLLYKTPGTKVKQGEVLGLSGGQTSGGYHPATVGSNGPHTHFGFWTKFVKVNGGRTSIPYGPDITPSIAALRAGSGISPDVGKGGSGSSSLVETAQMVLSGGKTPLTLAPNADVTELLWAFDQVLELRNPFDGVQTSGNLFDAVGAAVQVGGNIVDDMSAAVVRLVFLIAGLFVLFKITGAFINYGALAGTLKDSAKTIAEGVALFA